MADENQPAEGASAQNQQPAVPGIHVAAQFIRDLSFENPRAPDSMRNDAGPPKMEMQVELNARARDDGFYELDLRIVASATRENEIVFHAELVYGGVFGIQVANPEEIEPVLLIECPRYLFPFARRLLSDLTQEGGFPPFRPDPIDFASLYLARREQVQRQAAENAQSAPQNA